MKRQIIWSSNIHLEDWQDVLKEEHPEVTDETKQYEIVTELNNDYLDDERINLNVDLGMPILAIADLGLWNGRRRGYKRVESSIKDCLSSECDENTWAVDENGEFTLVASHHDGTNYITYRVYKQNVTDEQMEELEEKLYYDTATQEDIDAITEKIGPQIAKIYGWNIAA